MPGITGPETSSGTAAVAPASANRFQLRMPLGAMSSSRSSSAAASHPSRCAGPSLA